MILNEIQKEASTNLSKNISLISGAGTGKTGVLTQRFLNIVKAQDGKTDNILAITFTEKASDEMNSRVYKELAKFSRDLYPQKLNIMTIHSLCKELIFSYSGHLHINSKAVIDDEWACQNLLEEVSKRTLFSFQNDDFLNFLLDFNKLPIDMVDTFIKLYKNLKNKNITPDELRKTSFNKIAVNVSIEDLKTRILQLAENKSLKKVNTFVNSDEFTEIFEKESLTQADFDLIFNSLGNSKKFMDDIDSIKSDFSLLAMELDKENYKYYEIIINIIDKIDKVYEDEKKKQGLLDYDDLLFYTEKLVKIPEVLEKIKNRYDFILVDEFQDTNLLQNNIIRALINKNIFIVGDPKQAIYAFRGSHIGIFDEMIDYLGSDNKILNMNINYRTDGAIIGDINYLFENIFENYKGLKANRIVEKKIETYLDSDENSLVKLLRHLLKENEPKDIAILTRTNKQVDEIEDLLKNNNINVNKGKINLVDTGIVRFFLDFLSVLYNKNDFTSFFEYLGSPFANLSFNSEVSLLLKGIRATEDALNSFIEDEGLRKALDIYKYMNVYKEAFTLDEVIKKTIEKFQIFKLSREENDYLLMLYNEACNFKNRGLRTFKTFKKYLKSVQAEDLSQGINLLTIHSSKGLEFKTVVFANVCKGLNKKQNEYIIFDNQLGLAIKSDLSHGKFDLINKKNKDIDLEEEKRILYVAMTRAKDRLILCLNGKAEKNSYIDILNPPEGFFNELTISDDTDELSASIEKRNILKINDKIFFRYRENYSITDFLNYQYDPNAYYDKFFFDIDVKKLNGKTYFIDPKKRGNMVHYFAEHYNGENIKNYIEDLFKIFKEKLDRNKYKEIFELINNYLKLKDENILAKELEFFYDYKGHIVRGFIDQVIYKEGIYIVDLKTSDLSDEDFLKYYSHQLVFYSKVYEDLYKCKVKGAYIYSLKNCKKIPVNIDNYARKELEDKFLSFIETSREINFH